MASKLPSSWHCSWQSCKRASNVCAKEKPSHTFRPVLNSNKMEISFGKITVDCLLDSGADLSCISKYLLNKVAPKEEIRKSNLSAIRGVCGEIHHVLGLVDLTFSCQGHEFTQSFHVFENLHSKILVGLDFLAKYNVTVEFNKLQVPVKNHESVFQVVIELEPVTSEHTVLVRPAVGTVVPAHSEALIPVKIPGFQDGSTVLLEPLAVNLSQKELAGSKTICNVSHNHGVYRLMNPTNLPIFVKSSMVIAKAQLVDSEQCFELKENIDGPVVSNINIGESGETPNCRKIVNDLGINLENSELSETQKAQLYELLARNQDIFAKDMSEIGKTNMHTHEIHTKPGSCPVSSAPYRLSPHMREVLDGELDQMEKNGFISPSNTPWTSPVVMIKKPGKEEWRICIDYRKLNAITEPMSFPIPHMTDVFDTLAASNAEIFSTLDLRSGFWQVPLGKETKHKSGFITHRGIYEFNCLSFGMTNAPMTFQALMSKVLRNLNYKIALVYIDDVLIFSKNFNDHLQHLEAVFHNLREANLKLHPAKCNFGTKQVKYLGHIVSKEGLKVNPGNVDKILNAKPPRTPKEVKAFLGMTGYYRKFVRNYAKIAQPIQNLLKKGTKFCWNKDCEAAFQTLKQKLTTAPILRYPQFDKIFTLSTDSSEYSIGYVLTQEFDGKDHPICFGGRSLRANELNWHISDKEGLALVEGIQHFKHYLANTKFIVYTDNVSVKYLQKIKDCQGRLGRWSILLQGYDFEIRHRSGAANYTADFLSRQHHEINKPADSYELADHIGSVSCERKDYIQANIVYPGEDDVVIAPAEAIQKEQPEIIDTDSLADAQQTCPDLKDIYKYLRDREVPDDEKLAKTVAAEAYNYVIENSVLKHFHTKRNKKEPAQGRLVKCIAIPRKLRDELLHSYHDCIVGGGHQGAERTYEAIRGKYYWPSLYNDVRRYVQTCEICQQSKRAFNSKPPPLHPQAVDDVFSRWHMDILSGLPTTKEKYKHVLLVVDSYSKWCECFPLRTQEATEVASVLYREIISRYGAPRTIVSDRGRNFMSKLIQALAELFQIKRVYTSAYHPMTNGLVESKNSYILQALRAYCKGQQDDWPDLLPGIMMAYRSTPATQSTDYSPFFLLYGREMRLPIDVALQPKDHLSPDCKLFLGQVLQNVEICRKLAGQNIEKAQDKYKQQYDRWTKLPGYRPAQRVWLYCTKVPTGSAPKLHRKWVGPYYITMVGPNHTYRLRNLATNKEVKSLVNAMRLKPYYDPADRPTNPPQELQEDEEELDPDEINDIAEDERRPREPENNEIDQDQVEQPHNEDGSRNQRNERQRVNEQPPQSKEQNKATKRRNQMSDKRPQTQDRADGRNTRNNKPRSKYKHANAPNENRIAEKTQVRTQGMRGQGGPTEQENYRDDKRNQGNPIEKDKEDPQKMGKYGTKEHNRNKKEHWMNNRYDNDTNEDHSKDKIQREKVQRKSMPGENLRNKHGQVEQRQCGQDCSNNQKNKTKLYKSDSKQSCQRCRNNICKTLRYPEWDIDRVLTSKRYNRLTYYKLKLKGRPSVWVFSCQFSNRLLREFHANKTTQGRARKRPLNQNHMKFFHQPNQSVNFVAREAQQPRQTDMYYQLVSTTTNLLKYTFEQIDHAKMTNQSTYSLTHNLFFHTISQLQRLTYGM